MAYGSRNALQIFLEFVREEALSDATLRVIEEALQCLSTASRPEAGLKDYYQRCLAEWASEPKRLEERFVPLELMPQDEEEGQRAPRPFESLYELANAASCRCTYRG